MGLKRLPHRGTRTFFLTTTLIGVALSVACSSDDPLSPPDSGPPSDASTADLGLRDASHETDATVGLDASSDATVAPGRIVVSQVYGGGGSEGATFTHDFVELFNAGGAPASLAAWSLQYASAAGTGGFGASDTQLTELPDFTLQPGQYYLVQLATGTAGTGPLPTPDFTDPTPINMSATAGKIALVKTATPLGCNGGSLPCTAEMLAQVVDLVGFGSANFFEGSAPAAAPSTTTADFRAGGGCVDTDDNRADFSAATPTPRNTASPRQNCALFDGGAPKADAARGDGEAGVAPDAIAGLRIRDIQGRSHLSPVRGAIVESVPGIVTAVGTTGFYLQDPAPDTDDATSEGILVYTGSAPTTAVGDSVLVTGLVDEYRPSCANGCTASTSAYSNLTTTEIRLPTNLVIISSKNSLPPSVTVGAGTAARRVPVAVIDDDTAGNVETDTTTFDPASDGLDFYESLEGMRVTITDAVAVGPTSAFTSGSREIPVLADSTSAGLRTARGGVVIAKNDFNPERLVVSNVLVASSPDVNVGDKFPGAITGVIDYAFGKYNLLNVEPLPAVVSGALTRETLSLPDRTASDLDIASFNVENLDPSDPPEKFARLAAIIVQNLKAPDIVAVEEIQDDNGATDNGVVTSGVTFNTLIQAITTAGGPTYQFRTMDPENNKDGGEPGGNIRTGFLFRTDRGLAFTDRAGAVFNTPNTVTNVGGKPALGYSPGRIDPTNTAFGSSRKPLTGEFVYRGRTLFVIANHFNSKGGDQPLFGRFQPPTLSSEVQRLQQAQIVGTFVSQILTIDPNALVTVLGDLNDFEFSPPITLLKGVGLTALIETLPPNERYSYVYEGNSQSLDHLLVSTGLLAAKTGFDVVHVNAEFHDQASDHDPSVARFAWGAALAPRRR